MIRIIATGFTYFLFLLCLSGCEYRSDLKPAKNPNAKVNAGLIVQRQSNPYLSYEHNISVELLFFSNKKGPNNGPGLRETTRKKVVLDYFRKSIPALLKLNQADFCS